MLSDEDIFEGPTIWPDPSVISGEVGYFNVINCWEVENTWLAGLNYGGLDLLDTTELILRTEAGGNIFGQWLTGYFMDEVRDETDDVSILYEDCGFFKGSNWVYGFARTSALPTAVRVVYTKNDDINIDSISICPTKYSPVPGQPGVIDWNSGISKNCKSFAGIGKMGGDTEFTKTEAYPIIGDW